MNTYAIGDIHGNFISLKALIEEITPSRDDMIIFLGDYVDRGMFSKEVIDFIIDLKHKTNVITLRGNHEIMMMKSRKDYDSFNSWQGYGGFNTLTSYSSDFQFKNWDQLIPKSHWDFLEKTKPYYETDTHIFVHASLEDNKDLEEQNSYALYWESLYETKPHKSGKTIICGHTSQKDGEIKDLGHVICIDTWPLNAWLTCLEVNTYTYWQANENGEKKMERRLIR